MPLSITADLLNDLIRGIITDANKALAQLDFDKHYTLHNTIAENITDLLEFPQGLEQTSDFSRTQAFCQYDHNLR